MPSPLVWSIGGSSGLVRGREGSGGTSVLFGSEGNVSCRVGCGGCLLSSGRWSWLPAVMSSACSTLCSVVWLCCPCP